MANARPASAASARIIAQQPLFHELTPAQIQEIVQELRERPLDRGEMLFQKGDRANGFYVIVSGQIKLAFPSVHGAEKVVEILGPGQSFGEALMFMDRPYPLFAEAVVDTTVVEVPQRPVIDLLHRDPTFARAMLAGLARRLHGLIKDVESYSMRSSTQRLRGNLLQQASDVESGPVDVLLPASKSVIASRLNLTPETLSRVFHELSENGLIEVHGKQIAIHDIASLRRFDQ